MAAGCWDGAVMKKTNTEENLQEIKRIKAITHYANKVSFVALYNILALVSKKN